MTRAMLRYLVPVDDRPHEHSTIGSPVRVEMTDRPEVVEFWAEGDPTGEAGQRRTFQVFGTGQPLPSNARWVGTAGRKLGLVWHLYEV